MSVDYSKEAPIITARGSLAEIDNVIARPMEEKPTTKWYIALAITASLIAIGAISLSLSFYYGTGLWGNNNPVFCGFPIVNFVFWVGIGHAGTLISAILFFFRQKWRTSINSFAEAMTLFAVMCALIFPGIHVGRIWVAYWMFPLPNQMAMWANFRSPLLWDIFAVGTYFTVSLLFWYTGLIPDLASMRDRTKTRLQNADILFSIPGMARWKSAVATL